MLNDNFAVIVIGGGHAGVEAAAAAARMGEKTLLITQNIDTIGQMSCNPAIGGIGKSHLVKEVDALDGIMAKAIDQSGIQFRVLNSSKGPAVQATRAQADRVLYKQAVQQLVASTENLFVFQATIAKLQIENDVCVGVVTTSGRVIKAQAVVMAVGTFLGGIIHVGDRTTSGGRAGDAASNALSVQLREYGWPVGRLKTGTPPRIDSRTIDFSVLESQGSDYPLAVFSFLGDVKQHPRQIPCHISMTTSNGHKIIEDNLHLSAMFSGNISGTGPRYCPSIEDKIHRFDRDSHQVFLEPEGLSSFEVYPNGISTSLPLEVQQRFVNTMLGLERAVITRPGYAIEYDYFNPQMLQPSLATKVPGLFFCGQINGTTGYEEAAGQGILAGINAVLFIRDLEPLIISRDQGYIGVMVDDLITHGTQEPYRMFTSRAEYRLLLREDNADLRLTELGRKLGVVSDVRWEKFLAKQQQFKKLQQSIQALKVRDVLGQVTNLVGDANAKLIDWLKRSDVNFEVVMESEILQDFDSCVLRSYLIDLRYQGYIVRQKKEIERCKKNHQLVCQRPFDYNLIPGLSAELVEKLNNFQPINLGQASRMPGITPAALSLLMVYFKANQVGVDS